MNERVKTLREAAKFVESFKTIAGQPIPNLDNQFTLERVTLGLFAMAKSAEDRLSEGL